MRRNTRFRWPAMVAALLCAGAVRASPIHDACVKGDLAKVEALLRARPGDVSLADKTGATPLHYAAAGRSSAVTALLLREGADPGGARKDGVTPLHVAASLGRQETAGLLLAEGADPTAPDAKGRTPLSLATEKGFGSLAALLQAVIADRPSADEVAARIRALPATGGGKAALELLPVAKRANLPHTHHWFRLGLALYDGGSYREALSLFSRSWRLAATVPTYRFAALVWQGQMLDLLARRGEAIRCYEDALAYLEKDDPARRDNQVSAQQWATLRVDQYGIVVCPQWVKERLASPFRRGVASSALGDLPRLLETDPAAGFAQAARVLEDPACRRSLESLVILVQTLMPFAHHVRYRYGRLLDEAGALGIPLARQTGRWSALAELYLARTMAAWCAEGGGMSRAARRRGRYFLKLTEEASAKVDQEPSRLGLMRHWIRDPEIRLEDEERDLQETLGAVGPRYRPFIDRVESAISEGRDPEAVQQMEQALQALGTESAAVRVEVLGYLAGLVWVPGAERLAPAIWQEAVAAGRLLPGSPRLHVASRMQWACMAAWGGADDPLYRAYYGTLGQVPPGWAWDVLAGVPEFVAKMRAFGRTDEAEELARRWLVRVDNEMGGMTRATHILGQTTSPDVRRLAIRLAAQAHQRQQAPDPGGMVYDLRQAAELAPREEQRAWSAEVGAAVLETALHYRSPEAQVKALREAQAILEQCARYELARQAGHTADAIMAQNAGVLLGCAVLAAQSAATEMRWQAVIDRLAPLVANASDPSPTLLNALILLVRARRALKQDAEAQELCTRAVGLVDHTRLPPRSRATYLTQLAYSASDREQVLQLLRSARAAVGEDYLDFPEWETLSIADSEGLTSKDPAARRRALLAVIARREAQRERLALDPGLRQQWFSRVLGPYRSLLSVAAAQGDALLALDVAERVRARALSDQLAWRKVDLGRHLPAAIQASLAALRQKRQEVYGLLQRALALPDGAAGAELPEILRGSKLLLPAAEGPPAPADGPSDPERLKSMLASLAREEASLESAVREALVGYRRASQTQIPPAATLMQKACADPSRAVLVYSLAEDGVVVVGLAAGHPPLIRALCLDHGDLHAHVESFRKAIQEQDEAASAREARWLYQSLVAPAEGVLGAAKDLLVIPDGALQLIPFAALQGLDGRYLAERFATAYAPSLALALSRRGEARRQRRSAVVVAAPEMSPGRGPGAHLGASLAKAEPGRGLSPALDALALTPLPGARAEGEAIALRFADALLLTGKEATRERLWMDGATAGVLHIATHGFADPEAPDFSGLLLADAATGGYDVLTAGDVYSWSLQARLVVLSACETGLGKDVEGEGVLGLTRAFLYAGAGDVVCSLWSVSDDSTRKLMEVFYAAVAEGASVERALQRAQQALLADKATSRPFYWAAFMPVRGAQ